MSEAMHRLLQNPDNDLLVDRVQQILRDADYDGTKVIHPAFKEWFLEELTTPGMDLDIAESLFQVAKMGIDLDHEIIELELLETTWEE